MHSSWVGILHERALATVTVGDLTLSHLSGSCCVRCMQRGWMHGQVLLSADLLATHPSSDSCNMKSQRPSLRCFTSPSGGSGGKSCAMHAISVSWHWAVGRGGREQVHAHKHNSRCHCPSCGTLWQAPFLLAAQHIPHRCCCSPHGAVVLVLAPAGPGCLLLLLLRLPGWPFPASPAHNQGLIVTTTATAAAATAVHEPMIMGTTL
jgi:hypothetical protein